MPEETTKKTATLEGQTLGDLVSALRAALKDPEGPNLRGTELWIDEVQRGAGGRWEQFMELPLNEKSAVVLAQLLTDKIKYQIQIGTRESYDVTLKHGHALLHLLRTTATKLGINFPIEHDFPLSPSDAVA